MRYVVEDIGAVVASMRGSPLLGSIIPTMPHSELLPYYDYGHPLELANRLTAKTRGKEMKFQKYPLVALKMDFPEQKGSGGMNNLVLDILIVAMSKREREVSTRYEQVFKPILYPLYETFLDALRHSGLYHWQGWQDVPPHVKVDRPFWGVVASQGNIKSIFNDPLDAIEIQGLRISYRNCL